jgi:hypothetical protein
MIHFSCLDCGRKFQVKEEFAGRGSDRPVATADRGHAHDVEVFSQTSATA